MALPPHMKRRGEGKETENRMTDYTYSSYSTSTFSPSEKKEELLILIFI
jgi:hypothetical protein